MTDENDKLTKNLNKKLDKIALKEDINARKKAKEEKKQVEGCIGQIMEKMIKEDEGQR